MKLRLIDRLLAALAGVVLVAVAVPPLFDTVFGTNMLDGLSRIAHAGGAGNVLLMLVLGLLPAAVGGLCIHLALRRNRGKGFVVQTGELGEVSISIRALESLVNRCVEKHDELTVTSTLLENTRDGLVIRLSANTTSGVNIPKAVGMLQKQIRRYVATCSGVDVYEVKVQVDDTAAKGNASAFAVPDVLENPEPLPREEEAKPAEAETEQKEEKCLHQRLFGDMEEPAIVPVPPVEAPAEDVLVQEEALVTEAEPEAEAPAVEKTESIEETDAADESVEPDETEDADETELVEEFEPETDCVADEASIADLAALDGAEDMELDAAESNNASEEPTEIE